MLVATLSACDNGAPPEAAQPQPQPQQESPQPQPQPQPQQESPQQVADTDAAAAVAVLRDYYAAIDAGDFARAWHLWSGEGQASGQTLAGFTAGFADTAEVTLEPGAPGRIEGAAGSRYVSVPVTVRAVHEDGSMHRYVGSYVLRRAVVDGASAAQRAWRIASAELREAPPDQSSKR